MIIHCDFCEIHLAAYAADELPAAERRAVARHLDACVDCRAELERELELRAVLGSLPAVPCPDAVSRFLHDMLPLDGDADAPGSGPGRSRRPAPWFAGAGLVAASLLAVLLVGGLRTGEPAGPAAPAYSQAEIDQARRDVVAVLALTARVLDRSSDRTMNNVFGDRLPTAVNGSLRSPLGADAPHTNRAHDARSPGGQG